MKRLLLLLLIPVSLHSQVPPKKASKIIVMVKDTDNTLLNKISKTLFEKGFTIDTKDESSQTLSTKEFAPNHHSIFIKVRCSINDTSVIFTGTYAWTVTAGFKPADFDLIEYRGMKNSAAMQAWNSLNVIARYFGDKIVYSK